MGQFTHAQVRELVSRLTPEAKVLPEEPGVLAVSDWHEPLKFRHAMTFRGARPDTLPPAEMGRRAAEVTAAAGWAVKEELADARFATGRRDSVVIRVRVSLISDVALYQRRHYPEPFGD
ncbi:hypothetical protein [Streptomyces sp. Isolate_45]|uniref:hypothetical protein n=1 Tax=Streptomyces sp. Isolate_45 TaxID=2950111 RepID=UPI00248202EF|nr:hypothetical protein [Streptomyces sp. Isolate_45]MDA5282759.1 hypothetical protein [Streptomyces sp. Isolate_45]